MITPMIFGSVNVAKCLYHCLFTVTVSDMKSRSAHALCVRVCVCVCVCMCVYRMDVFFIAIA